MPKAQAQDAKNSHSREDLTGTTVGRFSVHVRLGSGGMGEVYRAHDTKLKRPVALKRMAPELRADERYRRRFLHEAERASALNDQHIASIYDVLEQGGELFLVMEHVEGQTLRRRLNDQAPSVPEVLPIATQCAEALVVAAKKRIVHHDIKPENIMLTPAGQAKILDFGVAKRLMRDDEGTTTTGTESTVGGLSGTVAYMAPEVLLERESDTRSDIFSLGVVLYEALTGRHPFQADTFVATSDRILHEFPVSPRQLNPRVPAELERIVNKMLAKDPEERYATAADLVVDLRALERGSRTQARPQPSAPAKPWYSRQGVWLTGATLALLSGVLTILWWPTAPPFAEREWIVVADFENKTEEPLFDRTVSDLLLQALQQSRYVNVVPRLQALEAARRVGRDDVVHLDAVLAGEICQRENYRALLAGEIVPVEQGFQLMVHVVDPHRALPVFLETETFQSAEEVYSGVDRLARRVRSRLGESLAQIDRNSTPLARVTTPSLPALQRYSRALDLYARGEFEAFITLANSAVELDPDFAMAHLYLAYAHGRLGNSTLIREHLARARARLDRVTERERLLILGADYSARLVYERAAEQYRLLTELYPDDLEGHRGLAETAREMGHLEEALQAQRRVLDLDTRSAVDYSRLLLYLVQLNRFQEALTAYQEARTRDVEIPQMHWGAGLAYLGLGQTEKARREFELLRQGAGTYEENLAFLYLARVLMYEGRMREAAGMLRAGLILDEKQSSETWIPVRRYLLAHVELVRGRQEAALREIEQLAMTARAGRQPDTLRRAGLLALRLGNVNLARQLLALLDTLRSEQGGVVAKSCYYNLRGELERARGDPEAAIESQRAAALLLAEFDPQLALGDSFLERGDPEDAIQAYLRFFQFKGSILRDGFAGDWVLTQLKMARAFAQTGDTQNALRYYDEFLRLWAGADPDLPALRLAKTEREELVANLSKLSK